MNYLLLSWKNKNKEDTMQLQREVTQGPEFHH